MSVDIGQLRGIGEKIGNGVKPEARMVVNSALEVQVYNVDGQRLARVEPSEGVTGAAGRVAQGVSLNMIQGDLLPVYAADVGVNVGRVMLPQSPGSEGAVDFEVSLTGSEGVLETVSGWELLMAFGKLSTTGKVTGDGGGEVSSLTIVPWVQGSGDKLIPGFVLYDQTPEREAGQLVMNGMVADVLKKFIEADEERVGVKVKKLGIARLLSDSLAMRPDVPSRITGILAKLGNKGAKMGDQSLLATRVAETVSGLVSKGPDGLSKLRQLCLVVADRLIEEPEIRRSVEERREVWRKDMDGVKLVDGDFYSGEEGGVVQVFGFTQDSVNGLIAEMNAEKVGQGVKMDRFLGRLEQPSGEEEIDPGVADIMRQMQMAKAAGGGK